MSMTLSPGARRVQDALTARGLPHRVVELPASTRTASDAARAVGCDVGQIAKSLVFRGTRTGRPLLVIASGAHRVDEDRLAAVVGEPVERATPDFARTSTGFAVGGVPPVGHARPLPTFIDKALLRYDTIWAAGGTPNAVFALTGAELVAMTGGQVVTLA
jgi:prolyl-tRNA editing enzyme YbaK/EbsC (Cys-tRNA(Pro) deacylase)